MKKIIKFIFLFFILLVVSGCSTPTPPEKEKYIITIEYNNGLLTDELVIEEGSKIIIEEEVEYSGYKFCGWFLDKEFTTPLTLDYIPDENVTIYAKWEVIENKVTFYVDEEVFDEQIVIEKGYAEDPGAPTKPGYKFYYWSSTKEGDKVFNFDKRISKDTNVYAHFRPTEFTVTYNLNYDVYYTKNELFVDYFTDFYNFMLENTEVDFSQYKIENVEQFLEFCANWDANGRDSFYGVGDAFDEYYVTVDIGGTLENQPTSTFIGYCYQNNKYEEFIPFLMQFFAYWRTDEGYTGGGDDPNNLGNDFFASPWASLVDTCKFFYFTSKNLNDTYPWFNSKRVKDALDNVPGVVGDSLPTVGTIEDPVKFIDPVRKGYKFLGWYDENDNLVTEAYYAMTVKAKWEEEK